MKRKITALLLVMTLLLTLLTLPSCSPSGNDDSNSAILGHIVSTYTNSTFKFKIKRPDEWEKNEAKMGTAAIFVSPPESEKDSFRESLNIVALDMSKQPLTLNEYLVMGAIEMKKAVTDYKITESKRTTIDGNTEAHRVMFTGRMKDEDGVEHNLKCMQIYTMNKNIAYTLSYTAETDKFDTYKEMIDKLLGTFDML